MGKNLKLATQIALVTGAVGLLASCSTAKVYSVVPEQKPSTEEIATLTTLQPTDTAALATATTTQTAGLALTPVDLATDRSVAMAYAMPMPKPAMQAIESVTSVEVASADPALNVIVQPQMEVARQTVQEPVISTTTALVEEQPKTRSLDAFAVTNASKNIDLNQLITKYAALYEVPEPLVHHVVRRESNYNPAAVHRGNWGLMQIRYNTARGLGYDGSPTGLLDAETNLKYAVKYLKGAWIVADKDAKRADWLYRTGYYYEAKRKRLLDQIN